MKTKHLIVDANNLMFRAHFSSNLTDRKGNKVSGVFGVMRMMNGLLKKFNPQSVIVAWDKGKSQERLAIYPEYKAQRDKNRKPEDVVAIQRQRMILQEIFSYLPVKQIVVTDVEADDIIGLLVTKLKGNKVIVSNDNDFIQLVKDDTMLWLPNKEKLLTEENIDVHLGFPSKHYILWKCMVGDSSDNIKGIYGIGEKKATAIILNGVGGGKKLPIKPEEQKILDRNKYLIAIAALLTVKQKAKIKKFYKNQRTKKSVNFNEVKRKFVQLNFKTLMFHFHEWKYPFAKLMKETK